jgi:hypothetical protein
MLKKYYTSIKASYAKSVQWTPFRTLSLPNAARIDFGFIYFASYGS